MRAFIAISLPKEIRDFLSNIQNQLKSCGADVRWVQPQNIHLTLKFLGEINEGQLNKINVIIEEVTKKLPPFTISINSIGAFPRTSSPKVIWAGIQKGDSKVKIIANELEERIADADIGIPKEEKTFSSHITIGRKRSSLKIDKLIDGLRKMDLFTKEQGQEFLTSKITLFKSTLTPKGPNYESLKEANLKTE
jgi:2'-5' RNA ligase